MANENCLDLARKAVTRTTEDGKTEQLLSDKELMKAFEREQTIRQRLMENGPRDDIDARVAQAIAREAMDAKITAAKQKQHAALNIMVRKRLDEDIPQLMQGGLKPHEALQATAYGVQSGVRGGRLSADAMGLAFHSRWREPVLDLIAKERPHIQKMLTDRNFDNAVTRELGELREGGQPGRTGDKDAMYLASKLAAMLETMRTDLNKLGANIGRLDGYAGPQIHNDLAMLKAGKEAWMQTIKPLLDMERTFPDAAPGKIDGILGGAYDTIVTGIPEKPTARGKGQYTGPSNLANQLGKHRVLHFRDADAAIAYRDQFGNGSTIGSIFAYAQRASRKAGAMYRFGPNPEYMFGAVAEAMQRDLKGKGASPKLINQLSAEAMRADIEAVTGSSSIPVHINAAEINASIRSVMSMAKLGGATITAMPTDTFTVAQSGFFRGQGLWRTITAELDELVNSSDPERKQVAALIGEGFDGVTGSVARAAATGDTLPGAISKWADNFYRWNFLTQWTDTARAMAGRVVARHLGDNVKVPFQRLHPRFQNVLSMNGIDAPAWEAIRQAGYKEINGVTYVTPDRIRALPDEVIAAWRPGEDVGKAKMDLELLLRKYIADETRYGVIDTDAASRRTTLRGTQPGTVAGEAIRYVMQFKGFPIAYTQRVLGRAVYGAPGEDALGRAMNNKWHIGVLLTGMTAAGYASMTIKDMLSGNWPPRDPFDPKVIGAAMLQGGSLGIYGDFLFGKANRVGMGAIETLSGPGPGTLSDLYNIFTDMRDGDPKAARIINTIYNNTPYANLFYVRPAVDILFMNALREWASPGYLARKEQRRSDEFGQTQMFPQTLDDLR